MDYPFYEELCRRKHPAAWWWLIGDRLYYLGLIPGMMAAAAVPVFAAGAIFGVNQWTLVWVMLGVFAVAVPTFFLGVAMKGYSYRAAER